MNRTLRTSAFMVVMLMVVIAAEARQRVMTFDNGDRYEGEYRYGEFHGRGVYTWADGKRYEGEYRDNKRHGRGVYTWADGKRYEGEYRDNKRHGHGVFNWPNGQRYEGESRYGKFHGRGVYTWPNGHRYEGEYRDNKRHGRGVLTRNDGIRYEGEYRNSRFHGRGVLTWPDGRRYEGDFRDGMNHGRAVFTAADGSRYDGEYRYDTRHGRGVFTSVDGERYEGEFRNGERHGHGVVTTPDGQRYDEYYVDGELTERAQQQDNPSAVAKGTGPEPANPKKLQAALAVLGFGPGVVDGKIGPKTSAAIAQWQESVGQEPTGTLDAAQQTALVNSAFGEQTDQKEQSGAQESSASTDHATRTDAFSGGCAERMDKIGRDIKAVSEAMDDYIRRKKNEFPFTGLSACGSTIIGYNATLNYVEALRRCPETDPTGEQLAAQETIAEQMGTVADGICVRRIDSRQRHSMKELLDLLTSLTPLDQWSPSSQNQLEQQPRETVGPWNQGTQGEPEQGESERGCQNLYHPDDGTCG